MINIICEGMDLKSAPEGCGCCICDASTQGAKDKTATVSAQVNGFMMSLDF